MFTRVMAIAAGAVDLTASALRHIFGKTRKPNVICPLFQSLWPKAEEILHDHAHKHPYPVLLLLLRRTAAADRFGFDRIRLLMPRWPS